MMSTSSAAAFPTLHAHGAGQRAVPGDNPLAACPHVARHSRLLKVERREFVQDHHSGAPIDGPGAALARLLPEFVFGSDHPCVMARSVLQRGAIRVGLHGEFGGLAAAVACHDLYECLGATRGDGLDGVAANDGDATGPETGGRDVESAAFVSYAALFPWSVVDDEAEFERRLWRLLQAMHEVDRTYFDWDASVASDPRDPRFSFSIGGRAWYVVGLHPQASRLARRFPVPAIVFNPHAQFEQLRASGRYAALRERIRERDVALQGSVNPMLADHGRESEAKQYSGRAVGRDWRCPFATSY